MPETRYMISDASKKVNVEAHVLRYWEEELEIDIPRNEMGHRYYTEEQIRIFRHVKQLKESGYQLKAIKMLLPKLTDIDEEEFSFLTVISDEMNYRAMLEYESQVETNKTNSNIIPLNRGEFSTNHEDKLLQFEELMKNIFFQAMSEHSQQLSDKISDSISERLTKEMNYFLISNEEKQEARFKRLDETIRQYQKNHLDEVAVSKLQKNKRPFSLVFFQKKKEKNSY